MSLPELPDNIKEVMSLVREWCDWVTLNKKAQIWELEEAESLIANNLAFLSERTEEYNYLYEKREEEHDYKKTTEFLDTKKPGVTDKVAEYTGREKAREKRLEMIETKYLYKILKTFCCSRKDILVSLTHRIKSKQNHIKTGYGT
jgi:hypothetical protein